MNQKLNFVFTLARAFFFLTCYIIYFPAHTHIVARDVVFYKGSIIERYSPNMYIEYLSGLTQKHCVISL